MPDKPQTGRPPRTADTTVVHITSVHPANDNRIRFKECRGLSQHGYKVVLVNANRQPQTRDDGVEVVTLKRPWSRLTRMLLTTFCVVRAAAKHKPALYHFHDPELLPYVQLLSLMGKRVVYDMHEHVPKAILDKDWISRPLRKPISLLIKGLERILLWRVPVIFAETSYVEDYPFVRDYEIVQNFPDLSQLLHIDVPKQDRFALAYMGGVSVIRGSDIMQQAFDQVKAKGHDIEMHLVGRGTLPGLGTDQPAPDGITTHGFLPAEDGFNVVGRCHVGLAVLKPIPNYLRSFPTKMFEYMALGLPIIVSDFPMYRTVLEGSECGYLVDPTDVDQVTNALIELIKDPERATQMGQRGRAYVQKHYTWKNEFQHLLNLYAAL
jgi:glycosyltransferase involved in cell wall biosynthesis